jgi:periplasmic divalent cation tolerance protein
VALTSCPSEEVARRISRALVEERLAACVTILPTGRSTYRWQGAIEEADELLCVIKTTADRIEALRERLPALHPYEVPELIVLDVAGGLPAYLAWLKRETR